MIRAKIKTQNTAGFTLAEITISMIIVSVLAGLAIPNFLMHVEKTRAAEAVQILETLYKEQTAFFYENGSYTSTITDLGIDIPTPQSYNAPTVAVASPIASIQRNNGSHTIRISSNGNFSCVGANCTKLGY